MRKSLILIISLFILGISCVSAFAHGADIEYKMNSIYDVYAKYDNGEPMKEAQVIIYAPNNPKEPYSKTKCDENGYFIFKPDNNITGNWLIQVRQAGHGASINIPIGTEVKTEGTTGFSTLQKVIMGVCVLWGLFGTAAYFRR